MSTDGGVSEDGRLYAVIDHVDGESLVEHCRQCDADSHARLALFLQVCEVVAYAHRNLVVHRDLKPGNILVTRDGRVKLLDSGVAKRLDGLRSDAAERTSAPYTSDYAAPEQLTGLPITTATDVYALGVVLFELLTGDRPWRSDGLPIARIVQQIVHGEPPSMSRAAASRPAPVPAKRLAGDLDAIVATCLHKDAADRYATVEALQRDIQHHLHSEPVSARRRTRTYVALRLLGRYRWAAGGAALLLASLATGLVATIWQAHRAEAERDVARRAVAGRDAVIEQLTSLFRTSLAQKGDAPPTARAMLDASAKNVLGAYRDNPQLLGRVIIAMADLYQELEDVPGQAALLEGFLTQAGPDGDRESLALAEQELAFVDVKRGHFEQADERLWRADAVWASEPAKYRDQRIGWLQVRATLPQDRGDLDGAIKSLQTAVAESAAYLGAAAHGTPELYNSLGIALSRDNRLDEALVAYRTSLEMAATLGESETLDSLMTLGNLGSLAYQTGQLRQAVESLRTAIDKQRLRTGDSAALAAALGWYGASLTALGRSAEAVPVLREGTAMAFSFTGTASPMAIRDRLFLVDALTEIGRFAEARELTEATDGPAGGSAVRASRASDAADAFGARPHRPRHGPARGCGSRVQGTRRTVAAVRIDRPEFGGAGTDGKR